MRAEFTITPRAWAATGRPPRIRPRAPSPTGEGTLHQALRVKIRAALHALQMNVRVTAGLRGNAAGGAQVVAALQMVKPLTVI